MLKDRHNHHRLIIEHDRHLGQCVELGAKVGVGNLGQPCRVRPLTLYKENYDITQ